jgi:membrane protease YdiL (CAAX protease family)
MSTSNSGLSPRRLQLRESRLLIALELALVAAIFFADAHHMIYFSKTPYLLVLGWSSIALRGVRWRDVGLRGSPRWPALLLAGIVAGVAIQALELFVTQPLLVRLTGKYPDLYDFRDVVGNLKLLLLLIAASWVIAGFGEELVWRGYLMNHVADLFGRSAVGWTLTLILVSAIFGLGHSYQDVTGVVENFIDGALLGIVYLASGRNLLAPIVAHGMTDSVDFLPIYSGHYPGM